MIDKNRPKPKEKLKSASKKGLIEEIASQVPDYRKIRNARILAKQTPEQQAEFYRFMEKVFNFPE